MARENNANEVAQLRIPAELNASFDQFFSALKRRYSTRLFNAHQVRAESGDITHCRRRIL